MSKIIFYDNRWRGKNGISSCSQALKPLLDDVIYFNGRFKPFSVLGFFESSFYLAMIIASHKKSEIYFFSYGPILIFPFKRLKVICGIHDTYYLDKKLGLGMFKYCFFKYIFPVFLKRYHSVFTVSHYSAQNIRKYFNINPVILYNRTIFKGDMKMKKLPELEGRDFILFVGNDKPHKNYNKLKEAYRQSNLAPEVLLIAVGVNETIDENERGVFTLSEVAEEVLMWLYNQSLFLIIPSLDEGFCLPAVECISVGGKLIHSNRGALTEVVGASQVEFDPTCINSIRKALIYASANTLREQPLRVRVNIDEVRSKMRETWNIF